MKTANARAAQFGPYSLDLRSGELRKFGTKIKMGEQSFQILLLLIEAQGEMVTREELRTKLWARDTFVDFDHGLNSAVQRLRDCLSDSAENPNWIETIPRRGYRFIGDVDWQKKNGAAAVPATDNELSRSLETPASMVRPASRKMTQWVVAAAILILFVAGLIVAYRIRAQSQKRRSARMIRSVAVLPLANLSGDPNQDYFADGLTDELTTMLAKNRALRVVSRTSSMQYKGAKRSLPEIARELNVDGILEASVERVGNRVHMTVQLIYAPSDTHVWAETYDRDLQGAFSIPEELAQTVAKEVDAATAGYVKPLYVNPEAHDAYLRGRYFWFAGNTKRSLEYFQKAVHIQPDYAAAWAWLGNTYGLRAVDDEVPAGEVTAQVEAAARKAVELDDSLPDAHAALAAWYFFFAWDLARADAESRRAVELDPSIAENHHLRSYVLAAMNRNDEALQEQKRSFEINPFAKPWNLGYTYLQLRQFDAAIAELRMRADAAPNEPLIRFDLSEAYWCKGQWNESERELEKGLELIAQPENAAASHRAFDRGGEKAVEELGVRDVLSRARKGYVSPYAIAQAYAYAGDQGNTLKFLEQSYREHHPWLIMLRGEPMFDFVHSERRYRALIKKIGLASMN